MARIEVMLDGCVITWQIYFFLLIPVGICIAVM